VIEEKWSAIDEWLAQHAPAVAAGLAGPALPEAIAWAEVSLSSRLPSPYRESVLVHDGEGLHEVWLFGAQSLLPLAHVVAQWQWLSQLPPIDVDGVEGAFPEKLDEAAWPSRWIPFAYDGAGGYLHIDLAPSPQGRVGQILQTTSDAEYRLVAPDFESFLAIFLQHLRSGAFRVRGAMLESRTGRNDWWRQHA
jgi:cell wall assembly regulator SMI1